MSSSAYTQARKKLKHTAFIELSDSLLEVYYSGAEPEDDIKRWKGYRCLGVDGSKIILPNEEAVRKEFGAVKIKTQYMSGQYVCAVFECCYDVLNHMVVKSCFSPSHHHEMKLAAQLLKEGLGAEKDLMIYDRGYVSYEFLAQLEQSKKNYVIRCSNSTFKEAQPLFHPTKESHWSQIVTLKASYRISKRMREQGLPLKIQVRLVSVVLSTGEIEVLITSLFSEDIQREEFKELYHLRWGVEIYHSYCLHKIQSHINLRILVILLSIKSHQKRPDLHIL